MRVYLRPATENDGKNIVSWRNHPDILKHCFSKRIITLDSHRTFFREKVLTGQYKQFIVERIDDDYGVASYPIAAISLKDFDEENHRCELCVFTSPDQEWNTESQSMAITMLLERAFDEYDMHKIYSYVFSENAEEVHLLIHSGFFVEARLKDEAISSEGIFVDVYRMAITKEEWLGNNRY